MEKEIKKIDDIKLTIKQIIVNYSMNEENQAGTQGDVLWDDDFDKVTNDISTLFEIQINDFAEWVSSNTAHENFCFSELVRMYLYNNGNIIKFD